MQKSWGKWGGLGSNCRIMQISGVKIPTAESNGAPVWLVSISLPAQAYLTFYGMFSDPSYSVAK